MSKPRMLVTGGSGYLGGWVVRKARAGWDVTATYLSHAVDEPGVDWRQMDVRDRAAVDALVSEIRPRAPAHAAAGGGCSAIPRALTRTENAIECARAE